MRIGLIADVHGNAPALAAVLKRLRQAHVSQVFVAGDLIGYYPFVNESLDLLRGCGCVVVLGNHEGYLLGRLPCPPARWLNCGLDFVDRVLDSGHRAWLATQPFERYVEIAGKKLLLCHGSPWSPEEYVRPDEADWSAWEGLGVQFIILGHTHRSFCHRGRSVLVLNPGSCGQPRDADTRASYLVLDIESQSVEFGRVSYDTAAVEAKVRSSGLAPSLVEALTHQRSTQQ